MLYAVMALLLVVTFAYLHRIEYDAKIVIGMISAVAMAELARRLVQHDDYVGVPAALALALWNLSLVGPQLWQSVRHNRRPEGPKAPDD